MKKDITSGEGCRGGVEAVAVHWPALAVNSQFPVSRLPRATGGVSIAAGRPKLSRSVREYPPPTILSCR
jgi:hypothetical protein